MLKYNNLPAFNDSSKKRKIGKRHGRGQKGAGQRSRGRMKMRMQSGGQNPFYRMHGKIGLVSKTKSNFAINVDRINELFVNQKKISLSDLIGKRLIRNN
jgi:ribosomal protein L15